MQRQPVARTGVDQRGDDGMLGVPGREPALELGLPRVERLAPCRAGRQAPRAVDDLVRAAHEAVQGVDGGLHVARQEARGAVVRRVVAALQAPACPVGLRQSRFGDDVHHE